VPRFGATATSRDDLRVRNLRAVLDAIHQHGPVSRSALRDRLGLSAATLTSISGDLIDEGIVVEAEEGRSDRAGRKPILLAVDYDHAHVVGVKVGRRGATLALTNLRAEVVATDEIELPDRDPDAVAEAIAAAAVALRAAHAGRLGRFAGLGLSLPGIVDPQAGEVRHSPYDAWNGVPFARMLEDRLGAPALVENDVNALAIGEAWFGAGRGHEDFLVVTLGRGVGLGIVIGGDLYRGPRGGAGELGHAPLHRTGSGSVRTVEDLLSDEAIVRSANVARDADGPDADRPRAGFADAEAVVAAADAGDEAARRALAEAGDALGLLLALLADVFAPSLIVLGGEGVRAAGHLLPPARAALSETAFGDLGRRLELRVDAWGDDAWARGAAGLAASRYLADVDVGR
jgi:predicted NBD/HSP70 family sugar kinase